MGRVLIVAGSDSGGGAGIQADIKTVTALGGYAATAVTALTAQNTQGVHDVVGVEPDFIAKQMNVVLDDIGADCVKTGMLHNSAVIETVAVTCAVWPNIPLVVDPVMFAKGGHALLEVSAVHSLTTKLLPLAHVVTPNIPEAEALADMEIKSVEDMRSACLKIAKFGCKAVLLKGGHLDGDQLTDVLYENDEFELFEGARIESRHTHGTGCTLASALAAGLAQRRTLSQSVARGRDYVRQAILTAPGFGSGHGPLNHGHTMG
ncbi:MAG: bifunctional hydroxymethylpyrimidine kinase/phosphomethylpyrimidine kinase [Rhodospirillaceae bacterium]|nr:bifunctional hydroxymethylpyrimidine kinase/phosphomethylpyrimidine kinase [Rhodospirillaceae bacterium]MBT5665088.1 bifunctional hydroxymethylpyrimidine kinase/phosphomethylpyrimidine kinase [Rhodospirillaceae bacterium]